MRKAEIETEREDVIIKEKQAAPLIKEKRIINWIFCTASPRFGTVRIKGNETPSGAEYIVDMHGTWVREDDLEAVLNKQIQVCCNKGWAKPINRGVYPSGVIPPPPLEL